MRKPIIGLAMLAHTRGALAKAVARRLAILPMHAHTSFALVTMCFKLGHYSSAWNIVKRGGTCAIEK